MFRVVALVAVKNKKKKVKSYIFKGSRNCTEWEGEFVGFVQNSSTTPVLTFPLPRSWRGNKASNERVEKAEAGSEAAMGSEWKPQVGSRPQPCLCCDPIGR